MLKNTQLAKNHASSIASCNKAASSMASVASSRPQKLRLPVQDIEQHLQSAGSCAKVAKRKVEDSESIGSCSPENVNPRNNKLRKVDAHVNEGEDLESIGSCTKVAKRKVDANVNEGEDSESVGSCSPDNVNPRKNKLRKLKPRKNKLRKLNNGMYEDSNLFLHDTASSSVRKPEHNGLVESEATVEQNLQLPTKSLGDVKEEHGHERFEALRSLLPDGAKIRSAVKRGVQAVTEMAAGLVPWISKPTDIP